MSEIRDDIIRQHVEACMQDMMYRLEAEFLENYTTISNPDNREPLTIDTLNRAIEQLGIDAPRQIVGSPSDSERLRAEGFDIMPSCYVPTGTFYLIDRSYIVPRFPQRLMFSSEIGPESSYDRDVSENDFTIDEAWEALSQHKKSRND